MLQAKQEDPGLSSICAYPVLIVLLGSFSLLKHGRSIAVPGGGKTQALLTILALRYQQYVSRDLLLTSLWPEQPPVLANQSLNSLVYNLRKQLSEALDGAALIVHTDGYYRLNHAAGVGTDLVWFETLVRQGDGLQTSDPPAAIAAYEQAIGLYRGDLFAGADVYAVVERERLRARFLTITTRMADHYYTLGEYTTCLTYAHQLLTHDPCREDAHRLLMRCYVRTGQRTQALRQYHLCTEILRSEFETIPEPITTTLYDQIRMNPNGV